MASRAFPRLGAVEPLDELEQAYRTSEQARAYAHACVELDRQTRACMSSAKDPLAAALRCRPATGATGLEPPPLFPASAQPHPMEARLHPTQGAPRLSELVGMWEFASDPEHTWEIFGDGYAHDAGPGWSSSQHVVVVGAGLLHVKSGDGYSPAGFVLASPDELYADWSSVAVPLPDERSFVAPLAGGYLVRDQDGCWAISDRGLTVAADCRFADRDGGRWLDVRYALPCPPAPDGSCPQQATYRALAGYLVAPSLLDNRFVRRK